MLTEEELKEANWLLKIGCKYIARDKDGELWAYDKAFKDDEMWVCYRSGICIGPINYSLFRKVSWKDKKSTKLKQLIGKHNASIKRKKKGKRRK